VTRIVALPVVLPLVGAALSILFGRSRVLQRAIGVTVLVAVTAIAVVLLVISFSMLLFINILETWTRRHAS
jgi:multicomponent Na+:H+ antiporter subunit D